MVETGEHELLQRAIGGDEDALVELLEIHATELRRRIEPRIPERFRPALGIDDVMQQTFVDACRDVRHLEPERTHSFAAWLEAIADQNLTDAIRMLDAKKRGGEHYRIERRSRDDSCRELIDLLSGRATTPAGAVAGREAIDRLQHAVRSLPGDYHTVVEMYDLLDRPIEDVARELGRSPGAVYMLRARAHRMLAEIFGSSR